MSTRKEDVNQNSLTLKKTVVLARGPNLGKTSTLLSVLKSM